MRRLVAPFLASGLVALVALACGDSGASSPDAGPPAPNDDAGPRADASGSDARGGGGVDGAPPVDAAGTDAPPPTGPLTDVTYTVDDTSIFASPARGFQHHLETTAASYSPLDATALATYRTQEAITHVMRFFYLDSFVASPISAAYLTNMRADFAALRTAGLMAVVRFAYTADQGGADADPAQVLAHIDQLAPVLADNADVIEVVQAGFVGAWGEWYYTTHFGNAGTLSAADWSARKSVVDKLLASTSRPIELRTPVYKRTLYGTTLLDDTTAFGTSAPARLGFHDDCFVADATDEGTFGDIATEGPYLASESRFVPVGGETCVYQAPRSACPSALADMETYHYSFLNLDYEPNVIAHWKADGCFDTMQRRLGYRIALVSGRFSSSAARGGSIRVELSLKNDGYASPFLPFPAAIVLRPAGDAGGASLRLPLAADARRWGPGASQVAEDVPLGDTPAGTYELLLSLAPPEASLAGRPEYAVRTANTGVWEDATGLVKLGATLTVAP
jgi:hypothetical protein